MDYNRSNFHKHTFCLFQQVDFSVLADVKLGYKSNSGSEYYFTEIGVYRKSNHWGRAANCRWRLLVNSEYKNQTEIVGFARWTDFYPNNETEKLFYIELNEATNEVNFNHKNHPNYNHQVVRNASETAKRIKEIKEVLLSNSWAKYLIFDDFEEIKSKMLSELVNTNESFVNLRKILKDGKK
ncbi:MAG: hypothetical protein A3G95_08290 [Flavobacteria bacterium RIFCSPLOWO2_12_FULL_31_7]|nr:MAG: hypothetical protein A3G95_08290 [Flavobacteria bacterium RIFCSPLOWO2_12_FULL_31_7]